VPPPHGIDAWSAAFAYEGVVRELIARLKYRHARAALGFLADVTAAVVPPVPAGAVVSWVPATPAHRRRRGFDHAELLARAVAARAGLPVRALVRRPPGPSQTGRSRSERAAGPHLERCRALAAAPCRGVLLVDDVATTGASIRAAAAVLRDSGSRWIGAVTVARTPPPGTDRLSTRRRSEPNTWV
jgi:predicted amidophosphoribosyltransferase